MVEYQILYTCPHCLIDGVLIESFEEGSEEAIRCVCDFCMYDKNGQSGIDFSSHEQTQNHVRTWILQKGGQDTDEFCILNFCGLNEEEIISLLLAKKPIASTFDVMEYLFPGFAGAGLSVTSDVVEEDWEEPLLTEEAYSYVPDPNIPIEARALAAVMLADGILHPQEEEAINNILRQNGLDPLTDSDKHGWMPVDIPIPKDPEALVLHMLDIAFIDNELDESEWRVIKEFARYWGCDRKQLDSEREKRIGPPKSLLFRMWNSFKTLLFQENV